MFKLLEFVFFLSKAFKKNLEKVTTLNIAIVSF